MKIVHGSRQSDSLHTYMKKKLKMFQQKNKKKLILVLDTERAKDLFSSLNDFFLIAKNCFMTSDKDGSGYALGLTADLLDTAIPN